jgi:hypothetical protein
MDRSLSVILVSGRETKIYEERITEMLSYPSIETVNDVATGGLVGSEYFSVILGIKLS